MKTISNQIKRVMQLSIIILIMFNASATNYETKINGNFITSSTWENDAKPGWVSTGDTVFIKHTITFDKNFSFEGVFIIESGASLTGTKYIQVNQDGHLINYGTINIKKFYYKR